jgi:hypothetical protein
VLDFSKKIFRQEVKDKDIEGALQLRNLSVTRWVARSESIVAVRASFDGIIAALDIKKRNQKMPRQGLKLRINLLLSNVSNSFWP